MAIQTKGILLGWAVNHVKDQVEVRYRFQRIDDADAEVIRDDLVERQVTFSSLPLAVRNRFLAAEGDVIAWLTQQLTTAKDPDPEVVRA